MDKLLQPEQEARAIRVMREYLAAPNDPEGRPIEAVQAERDRKRLDLIKTSLRPLLESYLAGRTSLPTFKTEIDGLNKRHEYWGFKGIKGQMFFNMVVNAAASEAEVDQELKAAIAVPASDQLAASRINTFASYVKRLGDSRVAAGESAHSRPKVGSTPFFLSYFWQIQDPQRWPVYYTNSVQVMTDLNLWQPSSDLASDYVAFKRIHEELAALFTREARKPFGLYEVEHVFWFKGGNPFGGNKPLNADAISSAEIDKPRRARPEQATAPAILPDSYVPPVIDIIPRLARNDPLLAAAAKAAGIISIPRALEKSVDAAFSILGFESTLLGQGQGRVPDGRAIDADNSYAIIWDAKARSERYSMGTDDRTIREYVVTQSRELRRKRGLRNVYYIVISAEFADDYDDPIRSLKMETDVSEVILLEADALVAMVEARLRAPREVTLGPDGLQRLFTNSGVLTAESIREMLA